MQHSIDLLFVYGSLLSNARCALGRVPRERLQRESRIVGEGKTRGVLYDLGDYPGFVATLGAHDWVIGEVLQLSDPSHTFQWLDEYEDVATDGQSPAMYTRVLRDVLLLGREPIQAYVYLYLPDAEGLEPVAGGNWLAWLHRRGNSR